MRSAMGPPGNSGARAWLVRGCAGAALCLVAPLGAWAAEGAKKAGMPQLEPTAFTPQVIWLVVIFVGLYLLLRRFALPRIAEVLDQRRERIADDLDKAEKLKTEAELVLSEYEKATAEGLAASQAALREAADVVSDGAAKRQAELAEKLARDIGAAEARIAKAREAAVGNVGSAAAEIAQAATERLIGVRIGDKDAAGAVGAAAKERG